MTRLLSTREVADLLGIHEKKVYRLITDQGLPATKVTGKWLFPSHLVEQWIENNTVNYPGQKDYLLRNPALFVVAGSNDMLLDFAITLFMRQFPEYVPVFGNLGSMGGLKVLRQGLCHIAASHLAEEDSRDFNFAHAAREMDKLPAVVNFCRREQGIILPAGNPHGISSIGDLAAKGLHVVNRALGTGTRLWFDRELEKAGVEPSQLPGYDREVLRHLDVGLEVLSGRAGAGPGIRPAAARLGLDFLPMHWERFDLLIAKERFFDKNIQSFLGLLHEEEFRSQAAAFEGYDLSQCGKMVYPAREL
jgi:excisionase family DNA binding protein